MSPLEHLRQTNQLIRSFLEADVPPGPGDLGEVFGQVSKMSRKIESAGTLLSSGSLNEHNAGDQLLCYRANLERLQSVLTGIQERLQSEREALLLRNRHLAAASRWAANAKALQ